MCVLLCNTGEGKTTFNAIQTSCQRGQSKKVIILCNVHTLILDYAMYSLILYFGLSVNESIRGKCIFYTVKGVKTTQLRG